MLVEELSILITEGISGDLPLPQWERAWAIRVPTVPQNANTPSKTCVGVGFLSSKTGVIFIISNEIVAKS